MVSLILNPYFSILFSITFIFKIIEYNSKMVYVSFVYKNILTAERHSYDVKTLKQKLKYETNLFKKPGLNTTCFLRKTESTGRG